MDGRGTLFLSPQHLAVLLALLACFAAHADKGTCLDLRALLGAPRAEAEAVFGTPTGEKIFTPHRADGPRTIGWYDLKRWKVTATYEGGLLMDVIVLDTSGRLSSSHSAQKALRSCLNVPTYGKAFMHQGLAWCVGYYEGSSPSRASSARPPTFPSAGDPVSGFLEDAAALLAAAEREGCRPCEQTRRVLGAGDC